MKKKIMKILLVNDDGIHAPGLHAAWRALNEAGHEVFVCVPDQPRSAVSHAITMHKPLRIQRVETADGVAHACNGMPADCVPLALRGLMKVPPDLIVSGINFGENLGDDVVYSGTVAGAMEGTLSGLPSMAISLCTWENPLWEGAAQMCAQLAPKIAALQLPADTFVNVNVPNVMPEDLKGIRITRQGSRRYKGDIQRYEAPRIGEYFWRGGEVVDRSESGDSDIEAVRDGYVSVTPLHLDLTRRDAIETLRNALL
jgi:5'-nucleotidase